MPNPTSWNFKNFDWSFGNSMPTSGTSSSSRAFPPDLIRQFTAGTDSSEENLALQLVTSCKRKSTIDNSSRPSKQFISERKMIEHLNGLHLSSDFTNHNISPTDLDKMEENSEPHTVFMSPTDLEAKLKNAQKITVCDGVRKITDDPLLPKALLEHAKMPSPYCQALVLWQPPSNILKVPFDKESNKSNDDNEESVEKREERATASGSGAAMDNGVMDAELEYFDNNNSSNVDYNNLDTMDLDL